MTTSKHIIIFVGESGVGKTTLTQYLQKNLQYEAPISYTTRNMRANECHGKDYYFLSRLEFLNKIKSNFFIEYDSFGKNLYGTSKPHAKNNLVYALSPKGAIAMKQSISSHRVFIMRLRTSLNNRIARLRQRNDNMQDRINNKEKLDITCCDLELNTSLPIDQNIKDLQAFLQKALV